jgi:hypothetical protein
VAARAPAILEAISRVSARERALLAASRGIDEEGASHRKEGGESGTSDEKRPMQAEPDKVAALRDAARALESIGARYALIGGVAVGIHSGVPRATLDVDLSVLSSVARSVAIRALEAAGFSLKGAFAHSVNFRHGSGEPLQLVFDPVFDAMIERAGSFEIGGQAIRIVSRPDLIAMKQRAAADPGRRRSKALRDQADIALLQGDVPDPDEGW